MLKYGNREGNALMLNSSRVKEIEKEINRCLLRNISSYSKIRNRIAQMDTALQSLLMDRKTEEETNRDNRDEIDNRLNKTDNRFLISEAYLDQLIGLIMFAISPDVVKNFGSIEKEEEREIMNKLSNLINQTNKENSHYSELIEFVCNALLYNFSGLHVFFENYITPPGIELENGAEPYQTSVKYKAIDPYNCLWDIGVKPENVHKHSQIFATFSIITPHEIKIAETAGTIFLNDNNKYELDFIAKIPSDNDGDIAKENIDPKSPNVIFHHYMPHVSPYNFNRVYRAKPLKANTMAESFGYTSTEERDLYINHSYEYDREANLIGNKKDVPFGKELVEGYIWIDEKVTLGLKEGKYNLYEFKLINGKLVFFNEYTKSSTMPVRMTTLAPQGVEGVSPIEKLIPMQEVATNFFLLIRNEINKITKNYILYDPSIVDVRSFIEADRADTNLVPVKSGISRKQQLSHSIKVLNEPNDLGSLISAFDKVFQMIEVLTPDVKNDRISSMDRPTQFQTASAVIEQDNRIKTIIKRLDDNVVSTIRIVMLEFFAFNNIIPKNELTETVVSNFGRTLSGIERFVHFNMLKETINMALQSGELQQTIDLPKIMSFLNSLGGMAIDMETFMKQPQQPMMQEQMPQQEAQIPNELDLSDLP